ncbi:hypothetical protein KP79_PYT07425 [Mizuhopecten yessoensis]|uniref:Uncharacterized protein n=2 Tax=Mizuhopecten yessoensis TaxID=6573 RepID=A0A210PM44_MIZYE|nr:hypothetical protein KP79_PYT07425 [Mizuhopecten yessoensis]
MPVFQWKLLGGKNCLGRNAHVFQLRVFDGKDGVEAWAKEQLFCSTPVLDHKCSRTNSGNKKRKKQLNTPRKLLQKNPWETWQTIETEHMFGKKKIVQKQAKDISQRNLRKLPGKLTTEQRYKVQRDVGQIIGRPWPVFKRRPGGKTSLPNLSRVLQPRNEQAKQDAQHRPQQPTQPEVQQTSQLQQGRHAAQLLPVQSEQDSESIDQHTTHFGAVHHDMSQTEQAAGEREAYSADFQKKLPSAKGCVVFKRRSLVLYHTCQIDCILFTIFLLVHHHPQMEQMLRNADDDFQWLYCIWNKCRTGKFEDAKLAFWLRHGIALPEEDFIDFKVKLEADWILEPLKIKIFHQMSKCKTCNESCVFGEVDQDEYFQNSIGAFAKRCVGLGKQFASFQDCIDAWSAEDVPCSKCVDGYCLVTRGLDCDQGQPPLLPVPTFFEESECSGCLGEFLLPVSLDDHHPTLEQPQEFSTGNCHYQLHALSYAIIKQTRTGENYIHERCKVWDVSLGRWQYFDGEGWNEDYSNYKMKTAADNTPGKSYRVAYFRLVNN